VAVRLKRDVFPKGELRGRVLGVVAVGLTFLRAVDAIEPNTSLGLQKPRLEGQGSLLVFNAPRENGFAIS